MKKAIYLFLFICYTFCFSYEAGAQIITTFAGCTTTLYGGDGGPATSSRLNQPMGVAVDGAGNIYIADQGNSRIRKIDPSGTITTFAGAGYPSFGGDGLPATAATIWTATGVAVDAVGNVYIADYGNNRIRKIVPSGIITTIAGTGPASYTGD